MKERRRKLALTWIGAGLLTISLITLGLCAGQRSEDYEHEAIQYLKSPSNDAITRLQKDIDSGKVKLTYNAKNGYLSAILAQLKVPVSSQILVFSKTSFQRELISPNTPRALYFNEGVYVGWVQGGQVLEFTAVDPQLGAVFYVLDQSKTGKPKFLRQTYECLQCHNSTMTAGVPGHVMRSVYARPDGQPEFRAGTYLTTDASPMRERWGGWYVTGKHGTMRHMGNALARDNGDEVTLDMEKYANVTDLKRFLDTTPYLSKHSDIVALMVIEHQTRIQNLITKANYHTRMGLHYDAMLNRELNRPADYRSDSTKSRIQSVCEPLVQAMLFVEEAPLTDAIAGTSGFSAQFALQGPKDKQGRSLRQLDLKRRLMRYPCSYLIYSPEFDALPEIAKDYLYRRLHEILTGKDQSKTFAPLSETDRQAILEILRDTKPDFAAWQEKAGSRG
jgi:hypothetical protein